VDVHRVSKPGRRVYEGTATLKPFLNGYGLAIVTTSKGLLTDKEARGQKVGGEVLCTVS
jgi:small subunit ribosomal protein S8